MTVLSNLFVARNANRIEGPVFIVFVICWWRNVFALAFTTYHVPIENLSSLFTRYTVEMTEHGLR